MKTLNPYQITWAILTPVSGIARKEDRKLFNQFAQGKRHTFISDHSPDIESAKRKLDSIAGKLTKPYQVLFITDKQFSLLKDNNFEAVATKKQLSEMVYIN